MSDVMTIPKYVATPVDDEDGVRYFGKGRTPQEAIKDFKTEVRDYADMYSVNEGDEIRLMIYTTVTPENSDWPEEAISEGWKWVLDEKVSTIAIKYKR